jgi:flagellar hook-associated protein 1 FlgK
MSAGEVTDRANLQTQPPATITFVDETHYTISGIPGTHTMVDGRISHYGWTVEVTGTPAAGDSFTISENTSGQGDNRNALKLADLLNQPVLNNGTTSLKGAIGQFISEIGVKTNQAQVTADAQKVVADEAQGALQAVSGVNLDEEAANLIRYQQAYMAIAQMIRVADTIFQSVLAATSR